MQGIMQKYYDVIYSFININKDSTKLCKMVVDTDAAFYNSLNKYCQNPF